MAVEPTAPRSRQNQAGLPFVNAAFGAVSGMILGLVLDPIAELLLPDYDLIRDFVEGAAGEIISIIAAVLVAWSTKNIERLDRFLRRYFWRAAICLSVLLTATIFLKANVSLNQQSASALTVTILVTLVFLRLCAGAFYEGIFQISERQEPQRAQLREKEAEHIAGAATAVGDPGLAAGLFGMDTAGRVGGAIATGCFLLILLTVMFILVTTAASMVAVFLYQVPFGWAVVLGLILAVAALSVIGMCFSAGEAHADTVPLDEKHSGIYDRPEG